MSSRPPSKAVERELAQAAGLYQDFRERDVGKLLRTPINWAGVCVQIGRLHAVEYETSHGPKPVLYRHDFKAWARPDFNCSPDGRLLLILPGNFVFTERGIVDTRAPERRG